MRRMRICRLAMVGMAVLVMAVFTTCAEPNGTKQLIIAGATEDPVWVSLNEDGYTAGAANQEAGAAFGWSVDISDNYAIVGAPYSPEGVPNSYRGAAYIFAKQSDGSWQFQQKLTSPTIGNNRFFGGAVTITDAFAAIASTGSLVNVIEIFQRNGSTWGTPETESILSANQVTAIDMNGTYIIASDNSNARVSFFHYATGAWTREFSISGSSTDRYGYSISINGDYAIIGADLYNFSVGITDSGKVYIYQRSGANWNEIESFEPISASTNENYGRSVSISSDHIAVGTRNTMKVYFYRLIGTDWQYDDSKTTPGVVVADEFANSLTLVDRGAVAGAYFTSSGRGCAYPFWNIGGVWQNKDTLSFTSGSADDNFGNSVAAYGHYLIIGAPLDDNTIGVDAGTVFFYRY